MRANQLDRAQYCQIMVGENYIAVTAHDLAEQNYFLVPTLETASHHAVETNLSYRGEPRALQIFAEQHDKWTRLAEAGNLLLSGAANRGMLGKGGDHKPLVRLFGAEQQRHGKIGGLDNFVNPPTGKVLLQVLGNGTCHD
jgi:hypothetical protein